MPTVDRASELFRRHHANPIITAASLPYSANTVFNPGAALVDGQTLLLLRVEDRRGISHLTVARSANGVDGWQIEETPFLAPEPDVHPEEVWGVEDPRIVWLPELGRWMIAYVAYSRRGPLVSLASTTDFREVARMGQTMAPDDKDAALFPTRFGGRWALIHRPVPRVGKANMWISFSPDLRHWGDLTLLLEAREGAWWDAGKIGLGPPPMETPEGWLIMYHGVHTTASGSLYRLGLALLDLDDPRIVLRRSDEWVFGPAESYERVGDVVGVVFPCGWTLTADGTIRLYYGAADTSVALATASLADVLEHLRRLREPARRRRRTR